MTAITEPESGDFALRTVPVEARATAGSVGTMLLAANISLPVLVMGGQLGVTRGLEGTVNASLWGGLVLALLAGSCAYAGARSRLSTYLLIVRAFGTRGGHWISLLLACSVVGWFGVVLRLFADTVVRLAGGRVAVWAIGGTLLMAWTTSIGFRALTRLSNVTLPAKLALLLWAIWAAVRAHGTKLTVPMHQPALLDEGDAISFVIGGWVVGAVIAPDFTRYARGVAGGAIASAAALGLGYPLVLIAASIPAILTGNSDLLDTMARLDMGIAALAIILMSSWANGALNLYSGSLMLAVVSPQTRRTRLIWAAALIGMVLGVAGIAERLIPYLTLLGLVVPPVAGVYLPRFFLDAHHGKSVVAQPWQPAAVASLTVGVAIAGIARQTKLTLTGVGAIDSLLVTAGLYLLLEGILPVRRGTQRV